MIAKANMDLNNKTILFIDLDDTLIKTVSGKTFAEDCTDFQIIKEVLDQIVLKMPRLQDMCIVTNQGGAGVYFSKEDLEIKLIAVKSFIGRYIGNRLKSFGAVTIECCYSMDKKDRRRKPNCGMLEDYYGSFPKEKAVMIGDASGKEGDFSDSDKKCAENFGIDYIDVRDFLNLE